VKFSVVADTFARIEKISGRLEISRELAGVFEHATPAEAQSIAYMCLGYVRPPYEGTQFNVAEKTIMTMMQDLFGLPKSEVNALVDTCGDVASAFTRKASCQDTQKTVHEVYQSLLKIEAIEGTGSQQIRCEELYKLVCSVSHVEAEYITRIVLGTLRLGFSDMTLLDAWSMMLAGDKSLRAQLEYAYNVCVDIGRIARVVKESGAAGLEHIGIEVGIPIRPAAAERLDSAAAIIEKIGSCCAQPKIDGFRLQVHLDFSGHTKKYRFFSRNLIDMSGLFPDLVAELKSLPVKNIILEGEAIAYDESSGEFLPFQETVKRKRKHGVEEFAQELPIKLFIFDCMYYNGESLLDKTQQERRNVLMGLTKKENQELTPHVELIEERCFSSAAPMETYFWDLIGKGFEGLVVKKTDSRYQPGKRNFNWIKLKRQDTGSLSDTIDCVILGYYAGRGKRAKLGIGAFLVGVYNSTNDTFETIAKIGTGMTDEQWLEVKILCDRSAVVSQPSRVVCAKALYPDIWVEPTYVCAVRADNITRSPLHTAGKTADDLGYALRFPRFMSYRPDKNPQDATTTKEIADMYKRSSSLVEKEK